MLRNRSAIPKDDSTLDSNTVANKLSIGNNAKGSKRWELGGKQSFLILFAFFLVMLAYDELKNVNKSHEKDIHSASGPNHHPDLNRHSESNVVIDTKVKNSRSGGKVFPSPMPEHDNSNLKYKVLLKPTFGNHRPDKNAVFAFAEGYDLRTYVLFIESLLASEFTGDIVLSVAHIDKLKPGVEVYLRAKAEDSNVVVYSVDWTCFKKNGDPASDAKDGMSDCKVDHMFGKIDGSPVEDPRIPRPVATARYDIYWVWALQYQPLSQILLIDVRDTYFQLDPFVNLSSSSDSSSGFLRFFGENKESVTIYKSSYNRSWIRAAYGAAALDKMADKTVICSGSTIGEQVALEAYLRAMILQFEDTKCRLKGCDQGFHNYLYYMDMLNNVAGISNIFFEEQGTGNVNNLSAMREKPLTEWGVFDKGKGFVLNWDKSISPVVHQFDRDDELKNFVNTKRNNFLQQWKSQSK